VIVPQAMPLPYHSQKCANLIISNFGPSDSAFVLTCAPYKFTLLLLLFDDLRQESGTEVFKEVNGMFMCRYVDVFPANVY